MKHELWVDPDGLDTFCLSGPDGNAARALLPPGSTLEWTVDANSHFEAMSLYYKYRDYGTYVSDHQAFDKKPYEAGSGT